MTETERKYAKREWYSHGLTADKAEKTDRFHALISDPNFVRFDRGCVGIEFRLKFLCDEDRVCEMFLVAEETEPLMRGLNVRSLDRLNGKVIEAYSEGRICVGLSVNPNVYK